MKIMFEQVVPALQQPWRFMHYQWQQIDLNLHYHPEYELVLTIGSQGVRHIGQQQQRYQDYDLVLLGPNLVHGWQSDVLAITDSPVSTDVAESAETTLSRGDNRAEAAMQHAYVVQLPAEWLEQWLAVNPALAGVSALLARAGGGLFFPRPTALLAEQLLLQIEQSEPARRQVLLLELLCLLSQCQHAQRINRPLAGTEPQDPNQRRLAKLTGFIQERLAEPLHAERLAAVVHLSVPHLHRLFKQHTEMTLLQYVLQQRIGHACELLQQSSLPVAMIASRCGFNSLASFNRQFLKLQQMTPRQFRSSRGGISSLPLKDSA